MVGNASEMITIAPDVRRPTTRLYCIQSLEYISLHVFEVFNSKAEPHQVIFDPILKPVRWAQIPVFEYMRV